MYQFARFCINVKSKITCISYKSNVTAGKSILEIVLVHIFRLSINLQLIILWPALQTTSGGIEKCTKFPTSSPLDVRRQYPTSSQAGCGLL